MRAVVISHLYADPANRAKLRALAGLGVTVSAVVPERWITSDGMSQSTKAGDDSGVQVTPVPVRGPLTAPAQLQWHGAALRRAINDFRPDLVHVEEEPWSQPAALG
ncbi:MAG TPA: glycosyltransferase, partial [Gemmatimonadales bacterium]|nr:glycosyltransferase [Gemmatimonadales bacterium]